MKLLKYVIRSQGGSLNRQILSWLCWLKHHCNSNKRCSSCNYSRWGGSNCEVYSTFNSKYPDKEFSTPNIWEFKKVPSILQEPPSLDFLIQLKWDDEGVPIFP